MVIEIFLFIGGDITELNFRKLVQLVVQVNSSHSGFGIFSQLFPVEKTSYDKEKNIKLTRGENQTKLLTLLPV